MKRELKVYCTHCRKTMVMQDIEKKHLKFCPKCGSKECVVQEEKIIYEEEH